MLLQPLDVAAQHRERERVERAHRHRVGGGGAEQPREALAQLARRLVGEGHLAAAVVVAVAVEVVVVVAVEVAVVVVRGGGERWW